MPDHHLEAQLDQLVSTLWQVVLLRVYDREADTESEICEVVELAKLFSLRCDRLERGVEALCEFVRHLKSYEVSIRLEVELLEKLLRVLCRKTSWSIAESM